MIQKILLVCTGLLLVGMIIWGVLSSGQNVSQDDRGNPDASVVYYYGYNCPHCKDAQAFLDEENIVYGEDFAKKEVWRNTKNQQEMIERASSCGLAEDEIGVPFLWADGECFIGTPDMEGYFKKRK
jgi:glutaredoxin